MLQYFGIRELFSEKKTRSLFLIFLFFFIEYIQLFHNLFVDQHIVVVHYLIFVLIEDFHLQVLLNDDHDFQSINQIDIKKENKDFELITCFSKYCILR
jgi:hypothetical protein